MKVLCKTYGFDEISTPENLVKVRYFTQWIILTISASNTEISPNFLCSKFCGKAQFSQSFGRIANRQELWGNCAFPQNFQTRKLGEISVFYAVICSAWWEYAASSSERMSTNVSKFFLITLWSLIFKTMRESFFC